MRTRPALASLALLLVLAGCGAGEPVVPLPATSTPAATPVPVPEGGLPLRSFGYTYGPVDFLSLPRDTRLVTSVNQPDNVTVVLAAPAPAAVGAYLREALPAAGFTVTATAGPATLTFSGHGWTGSVTAGPRSSAVLLRPAA